MLGSLIFYMLAPILFSNKELEMFVPQNIRTSLITDKVFEYYQVDDSLINKLLTESHYYNDYVVAEDEENQLSKWLPLALGLLNQSDIDHLSELLELIQDSENPIVLELSEDFKNTELYKINQDLIQEDTLSRDYGKSIYSWIPSSKAKAAFTLEELDKVIALINSKYGQDHPGVDNFNQFVRDFVVSEMNSNFYPISYDLSNFDVREYGVIGYINKSLNETTETPVGLKVWNEAIAKLVYQANSAYKIEIYNTLTLAKARTILSLLPWIMTAEISANPNRLLNKLDHYVDNNYGAGVNFATYYRGNRFYNENASEGSFNQIALNTTKNKKVYGTTYSSVAYHIALFIIGIVLLWLGSRFFEKNIRK
ncbi:hypothetical protein SCLARK_001781 [Spiroplasma clarkii]|nr:hypothetical protein SCLARK_001781 [Spiroplasma clarkii]